ncbi:MAG: polymerase subunit sigma-24 [Gemmatimonadetes bacterium]|nr:polymerase subunit sigma-24 [Gemmatimonadota bacterium]
MTPESLALHLLRELAPQVLGALARRHGDFAEAEDAVQEAVIAAAAQWPVAGVPDNPRGWLFTVAMRRLQDAVRSEQARRRREKAVAFDFYDGGAVLQAEAHDDDSLALLFMCCHPSLSTASAIALTLRAVGGLTTAEIARAFLVPEATMAQRISRAKQGIRDSGIPFTMPSDRERDARLGGVLHVLYLVFNEGYASTAGSSVHRADLANEAIRLTRAVHALLPAHGEVSGLLALMLLTDARRAARTGPDGQLVPLDEQDRTLWNRAQIDEGIALVSAALGGDVVGPYQVQAAIAAVHDEAARAEDTDWPQILALYEVLRRMADNPMVELGHAIATAMVQGPAAGLARLALLDADARVRGHYRLDAVRAHLLEMSGDPDGAARHYRAAAERTMSLPERDYLTLRAARAAASGARRDRQVAM